MTTSHPDDISSNGLAITDSILQAGNPAAEAFDDIFDAGIANSWLSSTGNDHTQIDSTFIGMDFRGTGALWTVRTVSIQQHPSIQGNRCGTIGIEVSSDGVTWIGIHTFGSIRTGSIEFHSTNVETSAAMWRLIQKVNVLGASGSVWGLQEMELLGEVAGGGGGGVDVGGGSIAIVIGLRL